MKISASILSIKTNIKENIEKLDKTTIDYLHLDIMDGQFVSKKTMEIKKLKNYLKNTTKPLDVHLMVADIFKYIDDYKILNPQYITFHFEATNNPKKVIKYIKDNNIKVGISIKPNTEIEKIYNLLPYIDLVLVMSVEPGEGGQDFIKDVINKISQLKKIRAKEQLSYLIQVDGGINDQTIKYCQDVDIVVVGSFITNYLDYEKQIIKLKENKYESNYNERL